MQKVSIKLLVAWQAFSEVWRGCKEARDCRICLEVRCECEVTILMLYVDGGLRLRQLAAVRAACSLQCAAQATPSLLLSITLLSADGKVQRLHQTNHHQPHLSTADHVNININNPNNIPPPTPPTPQHWQSKNTPQLLSRPFYLW